MKAFKGLTTGVVINESVSIRAAMDAATPLLADPREFAQAAQALPVQGITAIPAVAGVTWNVQGGPLRRSVTHFTVEVYEERRAKYRLQGGCDGMLEYIIEAGADSIHLKVQAQFSKLPWYMSSSQMSSVLKHYLTNIKQVLEGRSGVPVLGGARVELVKEVEVIRISSWFGAREVRCSMRRPVLAQVKDVYDVAIRRVDVGLKWSPMPSDSNAKLVLDPNWPDPGTKCSYRRRAPRAFVGWESGIVTIQESEPPFAALVVHEWRSPPLRARAQVHWRFEQQDDNTIVTASHAIVVRPWPLSILVPYLTKRNPASLTKQIASELDAVANVCEGQILANVHVAIVSPISGKSDVRSE